MTERRLTLAMAHSGMAHSGMARFVGAWHGCASHAGASHAGVSHAGVSHAGIGRAGRLRYALRKVALAGPAMVWLTLAGLAGASAGGVRADELPRRVQLGLAASPGYQSLEVEAVLDGATAANAGLRMDDIITSINGQPVADPWDVARIASDLIAGDSVTFEIRRAGRAMTLSAPATAPGVEAYPNAITQLGGVPFQGGLLRDILVTPHAAAPGGPVVYFLPGVACRSVESPGPTHPYGKIVGNLAARGIATYRVEKPAMGDSRGGAPCAATDFSTELAALQAGYRALIEVHGVSPDRIFVFGHSMGAFQAPLLHQGGPMPAGVIVFGAVVRRWMDYLDDSFRLQNLRVTGGDAAVATALADALGPIIRRIFETDQPLTEIVGNDPETQALLEEALGWDSAESFMGRTVSYWRGADDQRVEAAWSGVTAPVLSLYGEFDVAVAGDRDPRRIVEIINRLRPGAAVFRSFPETGHGFTIDTPVMGPTVTAPAFNDDVTTAIADWIVAQSRTRSPKRPAR